ncbi:MAG: hypothetical protein U0Y10_12700 [Spirosomataceae bacterium]
MQTKSYTSLLVQQIYVVITSLQLIFIPNVMLGMFGFEPTSEIWIKVLGVIVFTLAILYHFIRKNPNNEILMGTVYGRLFVGIAFVVFVVTGLTKPALVLFAGVDVATAIWTWMEVKK